MAYSVRKRKQVATQGHSVRAGRALPPVPPPDPAVLAVLRQMPLAAIIDDGADATHPLLTAFVQSLRAQGWQIRGVLPKPSSCEAGEDLVLLDLHTGAPLGHDAMQAGGPWAPETLASASTVLHHARNEQVHLVVAYRFGPEEAGGHGLADAMLTLMGALIPVAAVVAEAQLPAWRRLTGGAGAVLPLCREALDTWFQQVAQPPHRAWEMRASARQR